MDFLAYYLFVLVLVLVAVAFLTLLERKVLGYTQFRKGPNKLGLMGILQPFADAVKLFSKEEIMVWGSNIIFFFMSPFFSFVIAMMLWALIFSMSGFFDFKYSVMFFLCCISVSVYGVIFSGWGSNSKYALLGSLRAVAQTVSYELIISFLFFLLCLSALTYSISSMLFFSHVYLVLMFSGGAAMYFISSVVETNRAPFDLAEGESELVSGFNTEYGGLKFALIFLAEYASIIWMSLLSAFLFFYPFFFFCCLVLILFYLWFRSSFPRFRYDFLMMMMWKGFLLMLLFYYLLFMFVF